MKNEEILQKLKEIFVIVVNKDANLDSIKYESKIVQDLGVSSVGLIYLMVAVEETFNIDMSDASFNSFETVLDVINYIKGKC